MLENDTIDYPFGELITINNPLQTDCHDSSYDSNVNKVKNQQKESKGTH